MRISLGVVVAILAIQMISVNAVESSLDDVSYNQLVVSDWDSSLYNKPLCVSIPSNMSLCHNMNYKEMKMPNLLGHDTMDEVSEPIIKIINY
jgi:hypothetical protein